MIPRRHRIDLRDVIARAPKRFAVGVFLVALSSCGGGTHTAAVPASAARAPTILSTQGGLTSSTTAPVTVSDRAGSTFEVSASPVTASIATVADSFLWSAAPGQDFLVDTLTVRNPTAAVETLSDFDDLTSGLADDVTFVASATNVGAWGYSSDCGIEPAYPSTLCPISFGQGLTVDSDTADHDDRSAVELSPGSTAQITLSYGPVLDTLSPAMVSVYFYGGVSVPADLTP